MFNKIAPDKRKHFFAGVIMGAVLQFISGFFLPDDPILSTGIAFAIVIALSYGFELLSLITRRGHYELMDAVASIIGGVTGMLIAIGLVRFLSE